MLSKADYAVERAEKTDKEDEGQFSERIYKYAWLFLLVLPPDELVNFYLHGLKNAFCEMESQNFRKLSQVDQRNISAVLQVAVAVGGSLCALRSEMDKKETDPIKKRTTRTS